MNAYQRLESAEAQARIFALAREKREREKKIVCSFFFPLVIEVSSFFFVFFPLAIEVSSFFIVFFRPVLSFVFFISNPSFFFL